MKLYKYVYNIHAVIQTFFFFFFIKFIHIFLFFMNFFLLFFFPNRNFSSTLAHDNSFDCRRVRQKIYKYNKYHLKGKEKNILINRADRVRDFQEYCTLPLAFIHSYFFFVSFCVFCSFRLV